MVRRIPGRGDADTPKSQWPKSPTQTTVMPLKHAQTERNRTGGPKGTRSNSDSSKAGFYLPLTREPSRSVPAGRPRRSSGVGVHGVAEYRSEEHTSELQSHSDL